jgi:hypothetical protein
MSATLDIQYRVTKLNKKTATVTVSTRISTAKKADEWNEVGTLNVPIDELIAFKETADRRVIDKELPKVVYLGGKVIWEGTIG